MGLQGDGQPELMPEYLWEKFPELLEEVGDVKDQYGRLYLSTYPVYSLLSSYINALARIGMPYESFQILKTATDVYDILENPKLLEAKELLRKEVSRIVKSYKAIELRSIIIWFIETNYSLGFLASKLQASKTKTVIVVNKKDGKFSIRGALSSYLVWKLRENGISAGGHRGFAGGQLDITAGIDERYLLKVLRRVVI